MTITCSTPLQLNSGKREVPVPLAQFMEDAPCQQCRANCTGNKLLRGGAIHVAEPDSGQESTIVGEGPHIVTLGRCPGFDRSTLRKTENTLLTELELSKAVIGENYPDSAGCRR